MIGTEPHTWRADLKDNITFVGLDVHKATVCVAVAESGRDGEVRQVGVFDNRPDVLNKWCRASTRKADGSVFVTKRVPVGMVFNDC